MNRRIARPIMILNSSRFLLLFFLAFSSSWLEIYIDSFFNSCIFAYLAFFNCRFQLQFFITLVANFVFRTFLILNQSLFIVSRLYIVRQVLISVNHYRPFYIFIDSATHISSRIFENVIAKWTFCVQQFFFGQNYLQSSYYKN